MPQGVKWIQQPTVSIGVTTALGSKLSCEISRGNLLREIFIRFVGGYTQTAAGNTAAALGRGDEWSCISRIDLVGNGNDIIRTFSGHQLREINRYMYGTIARMSPMVGGGVANPTFDSTLIIPLWMPLALKPMDTVLDTAKYQSLRLDFTLGSASDISSSAGADAVTAFQASTIQVLTHESFGVTGQFTDCKWFPLQKVVSASNTAERVQLPVNAVYRAFLINIADGAGVNSVDKPLICSNVILQSGGNKFRDYPFQVLRDIHRHRLGWNRQSVQNAAALPAVVSGAAATAMFVKEHKSTNADRDAWGLLDLVADGYMGESLDTYGFTEANLEFNVNAACVITVIPIQMFPLRDNAKAA